MRLHVGTSGYSYKEWKGPFYPETLAARDMLSYYAERLPAVEINNTFYRLPRASMLESWRAQVPEHFRFAIKASRRITHLKRLKAVDEETGYLLRSTESLGDRLGVLLFQLPPNLRKDLPRLEAFLELLPRGTRAAFEFRHDSWLDDEVQSCLRSRDCALVAVDGDAEEGSGQLASSAAWGYVRLRRSGYERADLASWAARIRSQRWEEAFVFFKHEAAGAGPALAATFLELAERAPRRKGAASAREKPGRRKVG